jgi:phosphonoacetaldehyde hydrolase
VTGLVAVVFDWAGTMVDFGCRAPVQALRAAFAQHGVALSEAQVRADMGRAKRDHLDRLLADSAVRAAWIAANGAAPADADAEALMSALETLMARFAAERSDLVPGAAATLGWLAERQVRVGSCTGYTAAMMRQVLPRAAAQGYAPQSVVCAGDTPLGRPSPLMLWKVLAELQAWPTFACVKVDDAPVGMGEGVAAGTWVVGVAASGNGVGLDAPALAALAPEDRRARIAAAAGELRAAGADFVVDSVADLPPILDEIEQRLAAGERPGLGRSVAPPAANG